MSTASASLSPARLRGGALSKIVSMSDNKPVLYDMPVSNNGARCRIIIYKKGIEDKVSIKSPMDLGGLR